MIYKSINHFLPYDHITILNFWDEDAVVAIYKEKFAKSNNRVIIPSNFLIIINSFIFEIMCHDKF